MYSCAILIYQIRAYFIYKFEEEIYVFFMIRNMSIENIKIADRDE